MATFFKRAGPFESALIRAVAGQVKATLHDHPEIAIQDSPRFVRSMTKRVASRIAKNWEQLCGVRDTYGSIGSSPASHSGQVDEVRGTISSTYPTGKTSSLLPVKEVLADVTKTPVVRRCNRSTVSTPKASCTTGGGYPSKSKHKRSKKKKPSKLKYRRHCYDVVLGLMARQVKLDMQRGPQPPDPALVARHDTIMEAFRLQAKYNESGYGPRDIHIPSYYTDRSV